MKIKIKRKKRFDVSDSGALSDLAFLLIIFFIVIAVFNINRGFILGLPKKNSSKLVNTEEIIKVTLTSTNEILYQDNPVEMAQLEEIIDERLRIKPNMTILFKVSPEARYQDVVYIVEAVRKRDVENFSFSMLKPGADGE